MAHVPAELLYTKSHEWVRFTGETTARVGITDFAQNSLGDIVFVNLPAEGDGVTAGEAACDVESVKAVADIVSPVTGTVSAAGEAASETGAEAEALDTEDGAEEALPPQPVRATASTALTAITESFVRFIIKYSFFC